MQPFLRWPGGKRWFTERHTDLLPTAYGRYIEPFLGSGAIFFRLEPTSALLGDTNGELVTTYQAIKDQCADVLRYLRRHAKQHSARHYYSVRGASPTNPAARAARLIYLNRTCFNGIYRVNREGRFNVPKGNRDTVIFDDDDFEAVARLLSGADVRQADFADLISESREADLVFADPPYTVRHNNNAFVKYNENLFSWADQVRLADALHRASLRGARIVATNANHQSVRALYRKKGFRLQTVSRFSSISASADSRNAYGEVVILANVEEVN